jgi:hypothetical protein
MFWLISPSDSLLPNLSHGDHQVFDEMRKSELGGWRSPSRALEIAIHKAWYPITESVLHQAFDRFGVVEGVYVREGLDCMEAHVLAVPTEASSGGGSFQ